MYRYVMCLCVGLLLLEHGQGFLLTSSNMFSSNTRKPSTLQLLNSNAPTTLNKYVAPTPNNIVATTLNNNVATPVNNNVAPTSNNNMATQWKNNVPTASNNYVATQWNNNMATSTNNNVPTTNNNVAITSNNNVATQWNNNVAPTSNNIVATIWNKNTAISSNNKVAPTSNKNVISPKGNVATLVGRINQILIAPNTGSSQPVPSQQTTITASNPSNQQPTFISTNNINQQPPTMASNLSNQPPRFTSLNNINQQPPTMTSNPSNQQPTFTSPNNINQQPPTMVLKPSNQQPTFTSPYNINQQPPTMALNPSNQQPTFTSPYNINQQPPTMALNPSNQQPTVTSPYNINQQPPTMAVNPSNQQPTFTSPYNINQQPPTMALNLSNQQPTFISANNINQQPSTMTLNLSNQQPTFISSNNINQLPHTMALNPSNQQPPIMASMAPALITNTSGPQQRFISPYGNYPQIMTTLNIAPVVPAKEPSIMSPSMWLAQMSTMGRPYAVRNNTDPLPDRSSAESNNINCFVASNATAIYRSIDGSCNNNYNPTVGQSLRAFKRYLNPHYSDMHCLPRTRGKCLRVPGQNKCYVPYLPSARTISRVVHTDSNAKSNHSLILNAWAQFISNDLSATAVEQTENPNPCCTNPISPCYSNSKTCSEHCFPINIVQWPADRHFKTRCMEFVRSRAVNSDISIDRPREQLNMVTPFLDASGVYGSDQATVERLRGPEGGMMKVSSGELLPEGRTEDCVSNNAEHCFASGDERVNQSPELAMVTLAMVNFHNIIAGHLIETGWDADKIFEETKKIINAFIQRITYVEFLPEILNAETLKNNELNEGIYGYEEFTDPRISNVFSTAAFQFIHSLTPSSIEFDGTETPLMDLFNNQNFLFLDTEKVAVYMMSSAGEPMDRFFSKQLTDHYFQSGNISFDLVAQIIQRGRDHGLPSYNTFRRHCGLPRLPHFYAMEAANVLKAVYHNIDDVDVFVGGMVEIPLPGSLLGPTFSCLIARQFRDTKFGDSHWYESADPKKGFNEGQLKSIKAMSAAKILCDGFGLSLIPENPFRVTSPSNPMVVCADLPGLDFQPWFLLGNQI